jgi:two-component system OmpR family sensor kinase
LAIALTKDEKKSFISFYALFLGSTFILLLIISWLFYQTKSSYFKDLTISKMHLNASVLSSKIIQAHMQNKIISKKDLNVEKGLNFALYDKNGQAIISTLEQTIDLNKKFHYLNHRLILVDNSVSGHLGVYFIAIEERVLYDLLQQLKKDITLSFIFLYLFIIVLGFYLTSIFIRPIVTQRVVLNNFIKDTTHELNTPISALIMSVNQNAPLDTKALNRIYLSAKRISELYSDLTYLLLQPDTIDDTLQKPIELSAILDEQITYFQLFASKKSILLEYEVYPCTFCIDKESFIRICNNLIANAIKYTPANKKVSVFLKQNHLIIKDEGIGIKKENLSKVFKRFYKDNNTVGGFGIGLNIVSTICKKYDIPIKIKSILNQGTTIELDFTQKA